MLRASCPVTTQSSTIENWIANKVSQPLKGRGRRATAAAEVEMDGLSQPLLCLADHKLGWETSGKTHPTPIGSQGNRIRSHSHLCEMCTSFPNITHNVFVRTAGNTNSISDVRSRYKLFRAWHARYVAHDRE